MKTRRELKLLYQPVPGAPILPKLNVCCITLMWNKWRNGVCWGNAGLKTQKAI